MRSPNEFHKIAKKCSFDIHVNICRLRDVWDINVNSIPFSFYHLSEQNYSTVMTSNIFYKTTEENKNVKYVKNTFTR